MQKEIMRARTFNRIRDIVYQTSGIALGPQKEALVCARVSKRVRALGLESFDRYLSYVEENDEEIVDLLDAVSTNVTSFFREPHHFEAIADKVAEWYEDGQRRFRFWSAACSSGEEAYSLAVVLREALPFPDVDLRILATDICTEALGHAERGRYTEERLAPVPADLKARWFRQVEESGEHAWQASPALRDTVVFRRVNLSHPPFPMKGPLDSIFCRNVMIYFDDNVRSRLLAEAYRLLRPGGFLFVGHAESLAGMLGDFRYVRPSVYRKG